MEPTNRLNKFRASYSVLSTWETGDWQRAIDQYLRLDKLTTPQMEYGKRLHNEWEKHIKSNKSLPEVFGRTKLVDPKTETKLEIHVADWLDFVCIPDMVDGSTLYEFKTGANDANYWSNTWQTPIYAYALLANKTPVSTAKIYAYNQYSQKPTMALVFLEPNAMQDALNKMWTLASEMWDYIQQNKEQISNYLLEMQK